MRLRTSARAGRTIPPLNDPPPNSDLLSSFAPGEARDVDMPEIRLRHVVSCSSQDSVRSWRGGRLEDVRESMRGHYRNFGSVKGNFTEVCGGSGGNSRRL